MHQDKDSNIKIIWEKWIDPFGEDLDEARWNDYDSEENDSSLAEQLDVKNSAKSIKVIASPMGIIPYNEYTSSGKIFNFWVGHTNFNISKGVVDLIESCDGVEILDIFTRYRFRIGVGKCFTDHIVMNEIKTKCNLYISDKKYD